MDATARAHNSSPLSISTIGEDLTITGNVTSKGELHVNGRVQGDVHCAALVLGENAQVEGNVVAQDVMVHGRLIGSVRALKVMLLLSGVGSRHTQKRYYAVRMTQRARARWLGCPASNSFSLVPLSPLGNGAFA